MRPDQLIPEGSTTVRHCETVREADLLVQAIVEHGADARDLMLLAHEPTPVVAPPPPRPALWLPAALVAAAVVGALAGGASGAALVGVALAALVAITWPRAGAPRRLLVASSYDLVATGPAAARAMREARLGR